MPECDFCATHNPGDKVLDRVTTVRKTEAQPSLAEDRLLRGAFSRSRILLLTSGICGALVGLSVWALSGEAYTASAQFRVGRSASAYAAAQLRDTVLPAPVVRRVIEAENLVEDKEFVPAGLSLRQQLAALTGLGEADVGADRATRAMLSLSRVTQLSSDPAEGLITLKVSTSEAEKSARLANALADAFVADKAAARDEALVRDGEWKAQRLTELQAKAHEAAARLEAARASHDESGSVSDLARAKARTVEARAKLDQIQKILGAGGGLDAMGERLRSPALERLRVQAAELNQREAQGKLIWGDRHPDLLQVQNQKRELRKKAQDEWKRLAETATRDWQAARNAESQAMAQVNAAPPSAMEGPRRLRDLERDAETSRVLVERMQRMQDDAVGSIDAPLQVANRAAPPQKTSGFSFSTLLAFGLMGGLSIGSGVVLLKEDAKRPKAPDRPRRSSLLRGVFARRADPHSPETDILAILPSLDPGGMRLPLATACRELELNGSRFSRAMQHIALDLGERVPLGTAHTILVTSLLENTGKTVFSLALALAAARQGKRVLLLDANADNPCLERLVSAGERPSLISLSGVQRLIYEFEPMEGLPLFVVPIVPDEQGCVQRLKARGVTNLYDGISGHFDLIVIDGGIISDQPAFEGLVQASNAVLFVSNGDDLGPIDDVIALYPVPMQAQGIVFRFGR